MKRHGCEMRNKQLTCFVRWIVDEGNWSIVALFILYALDLVVILVKHP